MENETQSVEASLQKLADQGVAESSGHFTLKSERAQAMMERFLLEEPRAYVLNLVAAGVAAGAAQVEVYTDADDCIVSYDGELPSDEELQNLVSYALTDHTTPHLKELSMGVLGAKALKPRWVKVSVSDGKCLKTLTLSDEQDFQTELVEEKPGVKIHLKEAMSLKAIWRALVRPEARIVEARCQFSGVPVLLNGKTVRPLAESKVVLASATLGPTGASLRKRWSWRSTLPVHSLGLQEPQGVLFIYDKPTSESECLRIVLNGISFHCEDSLGWEGVGATVYCSHLQKDLSQNQIVRDQAYLQLVVTVQKQLNLLVTHLLDSWGDLAGRARQSRADILDGAVRRARGGGDWDRAVSILEKVVDVQESLRGSSDTETQRCRIALADCLLEAKQASRAVMVLLKEARVCEELGRHKLEEELWTRIESSLTIHQDLDQAVVLEVLEGLALCESRRGAAEACDKVLEQLKAEYEAQAVSNGQQRYEKVKLECQLAVGKASAGSPDSSCHRCGSSHLMRDCRVAGRKGASIDVILGSRNPDAMVFSRPIWYPVQATVCGDCGHVEFSVKNPRAAWTEYLQVSNPERGPQ